jgi:RHS repeat-associated protein
VGAPLTYQGGFTIGTNPGAISGDADSAAALNGTTGAVTAAKTPTAVTTNWSLEAWVSRLISATNGAGAVVGYGYDKSSRMTSIVYPGGAGTVSRAYDAAGRLSSVGDWLSHSTGFAYDANSELTAVTYPNTVIASYGYDRAGRLSSISDQQGTNSPLFGEAYSRDAAGQLTGDGSQIYGYDTVNRVTSGGSQGFGYDAADRITAQTVTGGNASTLAYDNADQLSTDTVMNGTTQVQKYTYGYDARGNRTSSTDASSNVQSYGWDQANRMASFSGGGHTASYTYNGDGLRTSKTVDTSSEAFTWDVAEGLPLIIQDGAAKYVIGPGGLPLEQINGSTVLYYHQDQLGSTRALSDSSGSAVATSTYDTYGNLSASTGTATNPFGFAGQFTESESGLIYLRARYYDPAIAQFVSRDPLASVTLNAYAYAVDNPTNRYDPMGLMAVPHPQAGPTPKPGRSSDDGDWALNLSLLLTGSALAIGIAGDASVIAAAPAAIATSILSLAATGVDFYRGDYVAVGCDLVGVVPLVGIAGDAAKLALVADIAAHGKATRGYLVPGILLGMGSGFKYVLEVAEGGSADSSPGPTPRPSPGPM